jgi:hypothetical protein
MCANVPLLMRNHLAVLICLVSSTALAAPTERRLHTDNVDSSTFLWNDWNKFVENYHPNYIADDDAATAWVEGAKSTGAGEWVRFNVTPLDGTTKLRIRIRNGYQKSKDLFKANARAQGITVKLLPSKFERKFTLEDKDGWHEITLEHPKGELRAVELDIVSVFDGSKYTDLCISDIQVFATSETVDNPAFEKSKREKLMAWRAARLAAAKLFTGKTDMPLYPAYEITAKDSNIDTEGLELAAMVKAAEKDAVFAKDFKDAIGVAGAVAKNLDGMTRVQIAPRSAAKLVAVDGVQITAVHDIATGEGPYLDEGAFRMPMLGTIASLFADQLRVLDIKDKLTVTKFNEAKGLCKDTLWAQRKESKEATGPSQLQAVVLGRCAKVEGREGSWNARTLEMVVFDANGRAVLVLGDGHVEGYRWATDKNKPMIDSARSLVLINGKVVEAKKRDAVAAK